MHTQTYYSLEEFGESALKAARDYSGEYRDSGLCSDWYGASLADAANMAKVGWADGEQKALDLLQGALHLIEAEVPGITFNAYHDVAGGEVDVARYIAGTPENMLEYEPVRISRAGRVITLCASISVSSAVSPENIMRRGAAITAVALALEHTGHAVELWADLTVTGHGGKQAACTRVLVKGAHDVVDPSRIAYAFAHPSMLRRLGFAEMHTYPPDLKKALGVGSSYGIPAPCPKNLPEGTIYLPELKTGSDVPDPERFILDTLRTLGLISND